jgi:hypothetical protein
MSNKQTLDERIQAQLTWLCDKHNAEWVNEYGDPGYSQPERGIILADWNDIPKGLADWLEKQGFELEWSDEWTTTYAGTSKCWRTSPDSYFWEPNIMLPREACEYITRDDDPSLWIEACECTYHEFGGEHPGKPSVLPSWFYDNHLEDAGFVRINPEHQESGWFEGQTDDPRSWMKKLFPIGAESIIFKIAETSQFYSKWDVWVKWERVLEIRARAFSDGPEYNVVECSMQDPEDFAVLSAVRHRTYLEAWRDLLDFERRL